MAAPRSRFTFSTPGLLLSAFLGAFCAVLGYFWLKQGMTAREMVANLASVHDYFTLMSSLMHTGGIFQCIPWWTPHYNLGQTLAPVMGSIVGAFGVLLGEQLGLSFFGDPYSGLKIVCLGVIFLSGIGMYIFIKRLTHCPWSAFAAAILYATCPEFSLKFAEAEHITLGFGFLFPPFLLWGCLALSRSKSWFFVLLLAASSAMLTLVFIRTAAGFLPLILVFLLWLALSDRDAFSNLCWGLPRVALLYILLGVLPNLPLLRDSQWLTMFSMSPLAGWQQTFSFKTAISWFNRDTVAYLSGSPFTATFKGGPPFFTVEEGCFYLGAIPLLSFGLLFLLTGKRREALYESREGSIIRLFITCGLMLTQLSCGPKPLLLGQITFLQAAFGMPNWAAVLSNFLILVQGYIIYRLIPPMAYRGVLAAVAITFYFFFPTFSLFAYFPPYDSIRAPWVFWEMSGSFCLAAAGGTAFVFVFRQLIPKDWHGLAARPIGLLSLIVLLFDLNPYYAYFNRGELDPSVLNDFSQVMNDLVKAPHPGRVMFYSGRYFYLLTPMITHRGLADEAFHSYLMSKWTREITETGRVSSEFLRPQLSFMGITYIAFEKKDPDVPQQMIDVYRQGFPVKFENDHFVIFENDSSMSPYFYAKEFVAVQSEAPSVIPNILSLAGLRYAPLYMPEVETSMPGLAGRVGDTGIQMFPAFQDKNGDPFSLSQNLIVRPDPHTMHVLPPPPGYSVITIPESYHPDWHAYADGFRIPVYRGFGCIISAIVPPGTRDLYFKFEPPAWYNLSIFLSALTWLLVLSLLGGLVLSYWIRPETAPATFWENPPPMPTLPADSAPPTHIVKNIAIASFAHRSPQDTLRFLKDVREKLPAAQAVFVTPAKYQHELAESVQSTPSQIVSVDSTSTPLPALFKWAVSHQIDALYLIPHDHSYSVNQMPEAVTRIEEGAEVTIGSRYLDGVRVNNWSFLRLFLSQIAASTTSKVLALPCTDPYSRFIVLNRDAMEILAEMSYPQSPYDREWLGLLLAAYREGLILEEFPVYYDASDDSPLTMNRVVQAMGRLIHISFSKFRHIS